MRSPGSSRNRRFWANCSRRPEIRGSRTKQPGYEVPIYTKPQDLVRCTRADGATGRGRIQNWLFMSGALAQDAIQAEADEQRDERKDDNCSQR